MKLENNVINCVSEDQPSMFVC